MRPSSFTPRTLARQDVVSYTNDCSRHFKLTELWVDFQLLRSLIQMQDDPYFGSSVAFSSDGETIKRGLVRTTNPLQDAQVSGKTIWPLITNLYYVPFRIQRRVPVQLDHHLFD